MRRYANNGDAQWKRASIADWSRLDEEKVRDLRRDWRERQPITISDWARIHGLHRAHARRIVLRMVWKDVGDADE